MSLLRWRDEYVTGITPADYEHKKLIQDINSLYDRWRANGATPAFLDGVLRCMSHHFVVEERLMDECDYDQAEEHRVDHDVLMEELRAIKARAENGDEDFVGELAKVLDDWLAAHIGSHDARMFLALGLSQ
jgi:hemerythrin-like metal-binding protein